MPNKKVALVTGGSKGLGKELILLLAKAGYSIATVARPSDELNKLEQEIAGQFGVEVLAVPGDLTKTADVENFCARVKEKFQSVEVIVNNAGFNTKKTSIETTDLAEIQNQFSVHALAPFIIHKAFIAQMKQAGRGLVVNILSDQVRDRTRGDWAAYCTTKHALYGLGKIMIAEAAGSGVKVVNAVVGGMDSTFRTEARDEYLKPVDVAKVLVNLLSVPDEVYIPEIVIYPQVYLTK